MAARRQRALFEADEVALPEGFRHQEDSLSRGEHEQLLARVSALEFGEIKMRGVVARRRIAQFGWRYSFESFKLTPGAEPPDYLVALQGRAEAFADAPAGSLSEILVTEYQPGATIGWHRDAPPFDVVVGISLLSPCRFRFRRGRTGAWETTEVLLAPRSIYVLTGPARREWQHSIPAVTELRYSITFRTMRERA
jgi:alkylated DNA repair dioxygenase AlkB